MPVTDPNKTIFGAAYDTEFGNIATAVATKYDANTAAITITGQLAAGSVNLTGASVPANGWYLSGTNILSAATNSTQRVTINATGTLAILAPTAGAVLNANPSNSGYSAFSGGATVGASGGDYPFAGYNVVATAAVGVYNYLVTDFASRIKFISGGFQFQTSASGTAGNPITFATPVTVAQNGAMVIAATGATGLTITGAANSDCADFNASSTSGQSFGVLITAGTTVADYAFFVRSQTGANTFLRINGNGAGTMGPTAALGLSWTAVGVMTVGAPAAGYAFIINASTAGTAALNLVPQSAGLAAIDYATGQGTIGVSGATSQIISGSVAGDVCIRAQLGNIKFSTVAGTHAISINGATATGVQTATFSATNKPGSATAAPIQWLPVLTAAGTQGYIPIFGA